MRDERVGRQRSARLVALFAPRGTPVAVGLGVEPVHDRHTHLGWERAAKADHAQLVLPVLELACRVLAGVQLFGRDRLTPPLPGPVPHRTQAGRPRQREQLGLVLRRHRHDLGRLLQRHRTRDQRRPRLRALLRLADRRHGFRLHRDHSNR